MLQHEWQCRQQYPGAAEDACDAHAHTLDFDECRVHLHQYKGFYVNCGDNVTQAALDTGCAKLLSHLERVLCGTKECVISITELINVLSVSCQYPFRRYLWSRGSDAGRVSYRNGPNFDSEQPAGEQELREEGRFGCCRWMQGCERCAVRGMERIGIWDVFTMTEGGEDEQTYHHVDGVNQFKCYNHVGSCRDSRHRLCGTGTLLVMVHVCPQNTVTLTLQYWRNIDTEDPMTSHISFSKQPSARRLNVLLERHKKE